MRQFIILFLFIAVSFVAAEEKEVESVLREGEILDVGAVGSKADLARSKAIADGSKSSESKEDAEGKEEPAPVKPEEQSETEKIKLTKVPTEEVAVAHKKAGDDEVKIATATEAAIVAEKVEKSRARRFA